jgi:hypothetical protein
MEDMPLFTEWDGLQLTFIWGPPIVAAIFTALPLLLIPKSLRQASWKLWPMTLLSKAGQQVR